MVFRKNIAFIAKIFNIIRAIQKLQIKTQNVTIKLTNTDRIFLLFNF